MHSTRSHDFHDVAAVKSPSSNHQYRQQFALGLMEPVRAPATQNHFVQKFRHATFGDAAQLGLLQQITVWKQTVAIEKWGKNVFNPHASADVDALTETVEAVLDAVTEFGPSVIKLNGLIAKNVQCEHLAALLRVSSTWQGEITGWNEALVIANDAVVLSGADPQDILFGMI